MRYIDLGVITEIVSAVGTLLTAVAALVAGWFVARSQRRVSQIETEAKDTLSGWSGAKISPNYIPWTPQTTISYEIPMAGEAAKEVPPEDHQTTLLRQYHAQGLAQSQVSFWFSIVFACLGFIIIGFGAFTAYSSEITWTKGALPIISGTVIDGVAALIFVQSNKARENMAAFFDRLRIDTKIAEALKLAAEIEDKKVGANLKAYLAMHFAGVDVALNSYRSVVGLPAALREEERGEATSQVTPATDARRPKATAKLT